MPSKSTAVDVASWVRKQNRPPPPKRTLLILRPTASPALKEFTLQYNRLIRQKINSRTAYGLYSAVSKAETAKDLISRLPAKVRESDSIQDALSGLQLSTFAAANWIRRFADDRLTLGEWVMIEEKKAGREMADHLNLQVKDLFAKITEQTSSKTVHTAFEAYEIRWGKQEEDAIKQAEEDNKANVAVLKKEFSKVEKLDSSKVSEKQKFKFAAFCAELEDSKKELTSDQQAVVDSIKTWLNRAEEEPAAWRTKGITTLGPFGIAANIKVDMEINYPEGFKEKKCTGTYIVKGPKAAIEVYEKGLPGGVVDGLLSPVFPITIKSTDPVAALIRIPLAARFFAFAYPVITGELEVQVEKKSHLDAFLLYGGFVYFDGDMKLIQCNGLWVGCQLQMSAPKELPPTVVQVLKDADRFRDITLPQLSAVQAKRFAWILPNEFPELNIPDGGWAYLYEDETANNYFSIASAQSVMGLVKAFSLRDFPKDEE